MTQQNQETKEPIQFQVFYPDKNTLNNNTPSFTINNPYALIAFLRMLERGIPEFEGKEFRVQAVQGSMVLGSAIYLIKEGRLTVKKKRGEMLDILDAYSEAINDPEYTHFVAQRRMQERLRGLAPLTDSAAEVTISGIVETMLHDEQIANKIITAYLKKMQQQYRPDGL